MSSKDWFVIHDGHHIGPFTPFEIQQMLESGYLHNSQLTWRSGMSKWVTIEQMLQPEDDSEEEIPAAPTVIDHQSDEGEVEVEDNEESTFVDEVSLPPLPMNEREEQVSIDFEPPPVPTPMEKMKLEIKRIQNKEVFDDIEGPEEKTSEHKIDKPFEWRLIPAGLILICFIISLYFIYEGLFPERKGYAGLSPSQRDTLGRVFERPVEKGIYFRYAFSKVNDSLWITSNYTQKAHIDIVLRSIKGQILGQGPVHLSAKAVLNGGFAQISKWKINEGLKVPYGKYFLTLKGDADKNDFTKRLKQLFWPGDLKGKPSNKIYDKGHEILFYPGEIVKFEAELKNYHYKVKKNILGPLLEQQQRYKSFLGMLNQIDVLYRTQLVKARRGKDMQQFEVQYNQDIGPLLRDLILDCNRKHLSYFNIDPKRAQAYDELVQYGKEVGEIAAIIAKETTSYKKLRKKVRQSLSIKYDAKISEIREKGKGILDALSSQITSIDTL